MHQVVAQLRRRSRTCTQGVPANTGGFQSTHPPVDSSSSSSSAHLGVQMQDVVLLLFQDSKDMSDGTGIKAVAAAVGMPGARVVVPGVHSSWSCGPAPAPASAPAPHFYRKPQLGPLASDMAGGEAGARGGLSTSPSSSSSSSLTVMVKATVPLTVLTGRTAPGTRHSALAYRV